MLQGFQALGRALLMEALVSMQVMDEAGVFRADNFERLRPDPPPAGDNHPQCLWKGRGSEQQGRRARAQRVSHFLSRA